MTEGAVLIGMNNNDMVEFLQWIRERGGECVCDSYEDKTVRVIRGTKNAEKVKLFNVDGVLGVVNVDTDTGEETE